MIAARIAVYGAIACTLWFNGSFAYSKGGALHHQLAMVVLALTIDLCKVGFLPAASHLWQARWYLPATLLFVLWWPALAFSTYAGYASITTNRAATSNVTTAQEQLRQRAQADYDSATAALATARASTYWQRTAGCTAPRTRRHRSFCAEVRTHVDRQRAARTKLDASPIVAADPELTVLSKVLSLDAATLHLTIALWPAVLLELLSSLGYYAIKRPPSLKASQRVTEGDFASAHPSHQTMSKSDSEKRLDGFTTVFETKSMAPKVSAATFQLKLPNAGGGGS